MKQYQSRLGQSLIGRRDGEHAMASGLANSVCDVWQAQGNEAEHGKWQRLHQPTRKSRLIRS